MSKPLCILVCLLLPALSGCDLATVTVLLQQDSNGVFACTRDSASPIPVDLTLNPDFAKHQDKIKRIEDAGFVLEARNLGTGPLRGQLWLSPDSLANPAAVRSHGLLIVDGITFADTGTVEVDFAPSKALIVPENRGRLFDAVASGRFFLYGLAADSTAQSNWVIDRFTTVVILSAGP